MKYVLIAGGAGFIGSHLCRKLLADGKYVLCLDNYITGDPKNVADLKDNDHFILIEHDVTQYLSALTEKLTAYEIEAIFHLASPASPNEHSSRSYISLPIETLLANSKGTYNLLRIAESKKAKFLFASTSEIYGDPLVSPQTEDYFGNVNPNGVRSVYDEAKRFGEAMTFGFKRKFATDVRIVRIFNTYGPYMQPDDGRVVSNFIVKALSGKPITIYGDGSQTRSFCFVSDMVSGLTQAMFASGTDGEVFNLGNPDERTVMELATMIKEMTGSNSELVHEALPEGDPKTRKPDITKAKDVLSWEPEVDLKEGLAKTIAFFRQ